MKTRQSHRQPAKVSSPRWLAYATASAATALAASPSAEGAIHYSGVVDVRFPANTDRRKTFRLQSVNIVFNHNGTTNFGIANFYVYDRGQLKVQGLFDSGRGYVSKLSFGQNISGFLSRGGGNWTLARGSSLGSFQWQERGIGYIGFRIDNRGGSHYGWMRVKMSGPPQNGFILVDYAYADPGEPIRAGQTSSAEQAPDQGSTDEQAPEEGSLGWLALGAVGLLAWRKGRSRAKGSLVQPI